MTVELVCNRWVIEFPALGIIDRQSLFEPLQTGVLFINSMIPLARGKPDVFHDFSFNFNFDDFRISAFSQFSLFEDFHDFSFFMIFTILTIFDFHDFWFSRFWRFLIFTIFNFSGSSLFTFSWISWFSIFSFSRFHDFLSLFWTKCWWSIRARPRALSSRFYFLFLSRY